MEILPICFNCINYTPHAEGKEGIFFCKAFPNGIPEEILNGDNDHLDVIPGQVGDFVYTEEGEDETSKPVLPPQKTLKKRSKVKK